MTEIEFLGFEEPGGVGEMVDTWISLPGGMPWKPPPDTLLDVLGAARDRDQQTFLTFRRDRFDRIGCEFLY